MTATEALQHATTRFAADPQLADNARRDAELLLLHTLGITKAALIADPARQLNAQQLGAYNEAIARRLRREPIQYITGTQEFYGLPLRVTPAVLIPRPETEHLVEAVLERLPHDRPVDIADVGVGSGAIAIALAANLPHAHITALDLSPAALAIAQSNATDHNLTSRIRLLHSDLLAALPSAERNNYFDSIVSNPPYVPLAEAASLHPQVREHEPASALFAGRDGLDVYRRLIPQAHEALKPGGLFALEIGHGQRDALARLLEGWQDLTFVDDLQGIPRVALARR
jgi:release factor glutamine methyltransferase